MTAPRPDGPEQLGMAVLGYAMTALALPLAEMHADVTRQIASAGYTPRSVELLLGILDTARALGDLALQYQTEIERESVHGHPAAEIPDDWAPSRPR